MSATRAPRSTSATCRRTSGTPVFNIWRDIKVYKDHAYIVSEEPTHGMQVFDLTRLRGVTDAADVDRGHALRRLHERAQHRDQRRDRLRLRRSAARRAAAARTSSTSATRSQPDEAGCVSEDGYTHDNQCVIYDGPDTRFTGREICFNSNEDSLTIVDVTDKAAPKQLSRTAVRRAGVHPPGLADRGPASSRSPTTSSTSRTMGSRRPRGSSMSSSSTTRVCRAPTSTPSRRSTTTTTSRATAPSSRTTAQACGSSTRRRPSRARSRRSGSSTSTPPTTPPSSTAAGATTPTSARAT